MKVSVNWLRQYTEVDVSIDELAKKIGAQLGAVEEITNLGKKYQNIVIARVVSCSDHPNADRLHVCKIDDGNKIQNIERDENGHVQVVCGAPNVREGLVVVWLSPSTVVPETFDKEPFTLEARDIRGQKSNGMLASPRELGISESHEGILEIDVEAQPGDDFAKLYQLDDHIIDIENKMFTHRPDCFGQLGVAREIAGILAKQFKSPDWYMAPRQTALPRNSQNLPLEIRNELPELVPRFMAMSLGNIEIKPSPITMQSYLSRVGLRPINNVVDITNYIMLLTGQPLHAYDYDKVRAIDGIDKATLVVRYPKPEEHITLLNGKEIEPRPDAIMIATDKELIGVGGVMGGADTEVDETTKNIILECATFDMFSVRRTAMAHGLFTDAVARFNKGQSPLQNDRILQEAVHMLAEYANAQQADELHDDNHVGDRTWVHPPVPVTTDFVNSRLGTELSAEDMKRLLENVEFQVNTEGNNLTVTAPFWRTDIETREDVVEEVGRLDGFDKLPLVLPRRAVAPVQKDILFELKRRIRTYLSKLGANEVLTYSFVHGNLLDKVGQKHDRAFQISNAISPGLQYYRLSLIPSLLEKIHPNIKAGYDQFALFEIGKSHVQHEDEPNEPGIPKEANALGFVYASKQKTLTAPYYEARNYVMQLLSECDVTSLIKLEPLAGADLGGNPWIEELVAPFEPNRSALLRDREGLIWGVVGEFKPSVHRSLKLPDYCAGFECDPLLLLRAVRRSKYVAIPRFPKVEQDICLKVPISLKYQELYDFVENSVNETKPDHALMNLQPVDIYQREGDKEHKQVTFRLSIASYERTMTDEAVNKLLESVATAAKTQFGAERI